jgi:Stage II sporulation protein E (SpoIIE)
VTGQLARIVRNLPRTPLPRAGAAAGRGDRLFVVTDGMLERDAERMNIAAILTAGLTMHPREAVQHLTQAVLQASDGELRDDATALCLDWHGGPPRDREATSGANRESRPNQTAGLSEKD